MGSTTLAWLGLAAFVVALVAFDLLVLGRRIARPTLRSAAVYSAAYVALGIGFAGVLWAWRGGDDAGAYLSGYVLEKSLSLDNVFVIALVFSSLAIPLELQRRVLVWGLLGAVVFRAVFILAGAALLDAFHGVIYLFGAFLVVTAVRLARHRQLEVDPRRNPVLRLARRFLPVTEELHGQRFLVRTERGLALTPLLVALIAVETTDVVFAVDSIPAIFAVTSDAFLVFAANAFALLGLRSLYFLLADSMRRFAYLNVGLAILLGLAGVKMLASELYKAPSWLTLSAVVLVLAAAIGASVRARPQPGTA